jgi:hypothetical protein
MLQVDAVTPVTDGEQPFSGDWADERLICGFQSIERWRLDRIALFRALSFRRGLAFADGAQDSLTANQTV